ncbi:DNA-binding protein [Streptomyces sp. MB09-01]|uniref:DNA-binding protein n=1 Tax=Streptomyces sp. MB09-01 TaxID=3028666 RepID=UPI0029A64B18|nr:DNA-binding protein [Streptomyces sp. MB09-01]MDX3539597.1 DNA-binding protein [Streptomyces sp. MB09-01]
MTISTTSTTSTTSTISPATGTPEPATEAELLLKAGAVLPYGTADAGPEAVEFTARAYRHPGLAEDDRVVVRLAAAELGAAEDRAVGFLGLEPDGEPAVVGLGRRRTLGFPEWLLVHHPQDGHHALALVPELERIARQARTKPKAALAACHELAGRLAGSVPHFLPVVCEEAARLFLSAENPAFAAQLFAQARKSEATHGLAVDEDRLDAVFLEFALAGALPVRVLTSHGKAMEARVHAPEAYERFRRLCTRRTAGGMTPSVQADATLRRLARAAGLDPAEAEQEYLAELLPLPAVLRASLAWWKAHRAALVALARREPAVRGALLSLMPACDEDRDGEMSALWLEILEEAGATVALASEAPTAEEGCADGTSGWLERFHAARHSGWATRLTPPLLLDLVERAAGRLRTELAAPGRKDAALKIGLEDVALLDRLLCLGVPVAAPEVGVGLNLAAWAVPEQRCDLLGLAADERFRPAFRQALYGYDDCAIAHEVIPRLAESPGGRPMLAEWVSEVARACRHTGLPGAPEAFGRLRRLPVEAVALAEEEVAAAVATDIGALLARTLNGGLFEELTWPAWEEAVTELAPRHTHRGLTMVSAWPHLIVGNERQVRVIDAHSTVLVHDLRIPGDTRRSVGFHYVDGALLVCWRHWYGGGEVQGYWHTDPDRIFTVDTGKHPWRLSLQYTALPLADGGLTTGAGALHRGDTALPDERPVLSDGGAYWVWDGADQPAGWAEYDPARDTVGRHALPGFLADALQGLPEGSTLRADSSWLRPAPAVEGSVLGAPVDGLLGWRIVDVPGQGHRACDTAGRTVTAPEGGPVPLAAVTFPGDDRPRALTTYQWAYRLTDPDGVFTAESRYPVSHHATGVSATAALPPVGHWFCLRPRDPEGSAALRAVDRDAAAALLTAAAAAREAEGITAGAERADTLSGLVRDALPQVTDPVLVRGVADWIGFALDQQAALEAAAARLAPGAQDEADRPTPPGPSDHLLEQAVSGLTGAFHYSWASDNGDAVFRALSALAEAVADTGAAAVPGRLHTEMPPLPFPTVEWAPLLEQPAALAYRAVAAGTTEEQRQTLLALLRKAEGLGLASAATGRWRLARIHLAQRDLLNKPVTARHPYHSSILPLGGGAFLTTGRDCEPKGDGHELAVVQYDPTGRFTLPEPYTLRGHRPLGDAVREPGWLARFLDDAAERGTAPWLPAAAEEFARLTGVTGTLARLVVAGLPAVDHYESSFLTAGQRKAIGVKVGDAAVARADLRVLPADVRRRLVAALLPADPARLWTDGPDVAAAAEVWNRRVGRRVPVPEWLVTEARRGARTDWSAVRSLPAVLDPSAAPQLSTDAPWEVREGRAVPQTPDAEAFSADVLTGTVGMAAWLAHRLPAGDPVRALLPSALTAVRQRLAAPQLLLELGAYTNPVEFRKAAGAPTRTAEHYEEYGAVVLPRTEGTSLPALRPTLLDSTGGDPYLPLLRRADQQPYPVETALRCVHDPRFAALLADPGAPAACGVDEDGTWWPQDPSRSAPELVDEVQAAHGLGADAAVLYLMLLAMPDPTDRNTARWTGWKPTRLKAARAELAATDLVVTAARTRAGRTLFLPGGWVEPASPWLPLEEWKAPMFGLLAGREPLLGVLVPAEPVAALYRRAWQRVREGDAPRFGELRIRRTRRR